MKKHLSALFLLLTLNLCYSQTQSTNTPPATLSEVVVTAAPDSSHPLTVPSLGEVRRRLDKIPGGVAVVDADDYLRGRAATMRDALAYVPGVFVQSRFGAEESKISIRGSGIGRNFHGRGLLVMQDGIPINLADGSFDMQTIEPLAARYVEVFRGGNALQYGSGYLGGAINYVSRTGYDAPKIQSRFEAGTYGYLRGQVSSGLVAGQADYYASLTHFSLGGYRQHSEQSSQRLFANVGYRFSEDVETRFFVTALESKSKLPGTLTRAQFNANPRQAAAGSTAGNQKRDLDLFRVESKTTVKLGEGELNGSVFYVYKELDHPIFIVIDQSSHDVGADVNYRHHGELWGNGNELTTGIRVSYEQNADNRFVNNVGNRAVRLGDYTLESGNIEGYIQNRHELADDLALLAGVQAVYASRRVERTFPGLSQQALTFTGLNPTVGLLYDFHKDCQAYMNVTRSFEAPTTGDLANANFVAPPPATARAINPVAAQTATTVEIGTRGRWERIAWDMTFYNSWVENELLIYTAPTGASVTLNADETIHRGFETGLEIDLIRGIAETEGPGGAVDRMYLRPVYNWNDFRFDNDPVFGNNTIAALPEHQIQAELQYVHPCGFYTGPTVEWSPVRQWVDNANTVSAPGYVLFGYKAGYVSKSGWSLFVEARNLADQTYIPTVNMAPNLAGADSAQFYSGDGRALYGGFEWKW
ncbi:MAG: TonB-dependent receptor [Verrucomicrobiae bacterium]|nr:TonB-dependent receptor [Verrucomicrobiae bacterium]